MAKLLTFFDPTSATSGSFTAAFPVTGCGTLHIKNASAVDVLFAVNNAASASYVVQAGEPRNIPVTKSKATINWSQQTVLNNNSNQQQSVIYVESYESGETIPNSQSTSPNVSTGNFVGNQQIYQAVVLQASFFNSGGTSTQTVATPSATQSVYVGGVDIYAFSNTIDAATFPSWVIVGLTTGFGSTIPWQADMKSGSFGLPVVPIRFPGPVKGITGQAVSGRLVGSNTGTTGAITLGLNVYYFVQ